MNITSGIRSYILDSDTKIMVVNNKLNITNYIDIGSFDTNKIVVKLKDKNITIKGNNLVISKLLDSEILITGEFNNIEFR